MPYVQNVWTGRHLRPMSEELRQKIESVDSKNTQQFVPTLLIGHNSLNLLDPSIASLDLTQLRNDSMYVCVNESSQSEVSEG